MFNFLVALFKIVIYLYEPMKLDRSKLLQLRAKRQWTQKNVAAKAGVSLPTYHNAENGKDIQVVKAGKIAKALRVDLEDLEFESVEQGA